MQAIKRIEKEIKYFDSDENEESEGFNFYPIDESNIYECEAYFPGPENSPYEGGTFYVTIEFPRDFPFKPPKFNFKTKIFHLNFKPECGCLICCHSVDLLGDNWSLDTRIIDILKAIQNILVEPKVDRGFCGAFNQEAFKLYNEDKTQFGYIAKEWTEKYAYS